MNKTIIGVDIGGTKIRGVLWNGKKVLKTFEAATPRNLTDFKLIFAKLIRFPGKANPPAPSLPAGQARLRRADKIAVGVAGIVSGTRVIESPNIPCLKYFNFLGVLLDNDARCFGRAEYNLGGAVGKKTVLFITLGTGVGRAVGKNGRILKIKKFEYPESWEREYQKIRDSQNDIKLAKYLGIKLIRLSKLYHPQIIIIGGGILKRKGLLTKIKEISKLPIQKSKLKENAVAIGAAMLFIK